MLFFVFFSAAKAQPTNPRPCFSPIRLSDTCNSNYLRNEFVFVGKVISLGRQNKDLGKATVQIETSFKGELKKQVDVFFSLSLCHLKIEKDGEYIFTASSFVNESLKGLFSNEWSESISDFLRSQESKKAQRDLKRIIAAVRSVTKNEKQPRIAGEIQRLFDVEKLHLEYKHITTKSGGTELKLSNPYRPFSIDPNFYRPFSQAVIEAQRADGKRFRTRADEDGKYEFKELSDGRYKVYPVLPDGFTFNSFVVLEIPVYEDKPKTIATVNVDNAICSKTINFKTVLTGSLSIHVSKVSKDWSYNPSVSLYKIDKSGIRDFYDSNDYDVRNFARLKKGRTGGFDFIITGIPIGKYTLPIDYFFGYEHPSFYPGVPDIDKAEVIEIKPNNTTRINIKYFPPLENK